MTHLIVRCIENCCVFWHIRRKCVESSVTTVDGVHWRQRMTLIDGSQIVQLARAIPQVFVAAAFLGQDLHTTNPTHTQLTHINESHHVARHVLTCLYCITVSTGRLMYGFCAHNNKCRSVMNSAYRSFKIHSINREQFHGLPANSKLSNDSGNCSLPCMCFKLFHRKSRCFSAGSSRNNVGRV